MPDGDLFMEKTAVISDCGKYRYRLGRRWSNVGRPCLFIMLNPSTADAFEDDPTIRRCIAFAKSWGCSELTVVNLFAVRATDPKDMMAASDPVGPDNMEHVKSAADFAVRGYCYPKDCNGPVVCAWGAHGAYMDQANTVLGWLEAELIKPVCLGITKSGQPKHPLYLASDTPLTPYPSDFERKSGD